MDMPEPDQSPFMVVSAHTSRITRHYQSYLDKATPYTAYRWVGTGVLLILFFLRIIFAQGWYIVAYTLGIYLLNLFLAFLQPKFDPSLTQDEGLEDGENALPTKQDDEFRPFIRRLPEFKFWHSATRAIAIGFFCSWLEMFNIPVFWPVLVVYWLILFSLTSAYFLLSVPMSQSIAGLWDKIADDQLLSATTNTTYDQVPLCPLHLRKNKIWPELKRPQVWACVSISSRGAFFSLHLVPFSFSNDYVT
ncbi:protein RER1 [Polytolypa hystricis UAMH7299]|uniref:Protein RER1 n=1 Tax=Polytolypa hystricis (strain UAMH7299) TaxID=1447883 RepID=A0A2B7Y6I9_POLH7|nr:protein RER1 [Polytolypa hystricis UAMH7299]